MSRILFASYGIFRNGYGSLENYQGEGHTVENYNMYGKGGIANVSIDDRDHKTPVRVSVYELSPEVLARVDRTEGTFYGYPARSWYYRSQVMVRLDDGEELLCWMYHINTKTTRPILTGDWLKQD